MSAHRNEEVWARLAERAPAALVERLRERTAEHGRASFDPLSIAQELALDPTAVRSALVFAVELGALDRLVSVAIHVPCGTSLSADDLTAGFCPQDGTELRESEIRHEELFIRDAPPSRDVSWVLCVHGMNTRGCWQEALAWRIATAYRRSVPVYVYKYGRVQMGVVVRARQRALADKLAATIENLAGEPQGSRLGPRPDVVAHSFGTWLIGHTLLRNEQLRVGRIVLVASILRPDFPWRTILDRGQADGVMVHRGGKDLPVRLAAYAIPEAGPSGHRGFDPGVPVVDRLEPDFSHSTFFDEDRLNGMFLSHWRPFLTAPSISTAPGLDAPASAWKAPPRVVPWMTQAVILILILVGAVALAVTFARGIASYS